MSDDGPFGYRSFDDTSAGDLDVDDNVHIGFRRAF